jgi:hypothetical protein
MSAETLRRAARLMRERAEAARPSPWQVDAEWWHDDDELGGMDSTNLVTAGGERKPVAVTAPRDLNDQHNRNADMAHVASWHPAVALAVADWLDSVALAERDEVNGADIHNALTVARDYLGESS